MNTPKNNTEDLVFLLERLEDMFEANNSVLRSISRELLILNTPQELRENQRRLFKLEDLVADSVWLMEHYIKQKDLAKSKAAKANIQASIDHTKEIIDGYNSEIKELRSV